MMTLIQRQKRVCVGPVTDLYRASAGNTLTEYALVGALVIVVCILTLQYMSSGLNSAMAMVRQDMQNHQNKAASLQAVQKAIANGQITQLSAADQAVLEQSLAQKLQTTGANGSTELMAQQLTAAAAALLAQGKIDQSQYDILMQLSNQGHKMAQIEGLIAQAVNMAGGDYNKFSNMHFTVDGQTYSAPELGGLIGFNGPTPYYFVNNTVFDPNAASSADPALAKFLDLYNQAQAMGALSDPAAASTVTSAATQIASIGELAESSTVDMGNGAPVNMSSVNAQQASAASAMNSSQICSAGKFHDNGALCSP